MGQRLVIHIFNNEEELANAYYHWSAYTDSSIITTLQITAVYDDLKRKISDKKLLAIKLLEATGAGFNENDMKKVKEIYPNKKFNPCTDRNEGLIAVTEDSMEESTQWEEGSVKINLDSETICFDVLWEETIDDLMCDVDYVEELSKEEYEKEAKKIIEDIEKLDYDGDITSIPISEFEKFSESMLKIDYLMIINDVVFSKIA